jgi:hypothetical protein
MGMTGKVFSASAFLARPVNAAETRGALCYATASGSAALGTGVANMLIICWFYRSGCCCNAVNLRKCESIPNRATAFSGDRIRGATPIAPAPHCFLAALRAEAVSHTRRIYPACRNESRAPDSVTISRMILR